jgi:hypothetical protein
MRQITPKRSGVVALIAMMFLIVFASLAVGFYATCNSSVIVSSNEAISEVAMSAGESGMDFMRYQMANITMPYGTTPANLLNNTATVLGAAQRHPQHGRQHRERRQQRHQHSLGHRLDHPRLTKPRPASAPPSPRSPHLHTHRHRPRRPTRATMTRAIRMEYKPAARSHSFLSASPPSP